VRDITANVRGRKPEPQNQKSAKKYLFAKKFIPILIIALGISGLALTSLVSAGNTVNWVGNGANNGTLDTIQCDANNTAYLLWIFTGNGATSARITIKSGSTPLVSAASMTQKGQGAYQYQSGYYDPSTITASVDYTGTVKGRPVLTISHGCPGGTSVTATTLKDSSNNAVSEGASVPLGSVIHDTATVTLTPSAVPTGSVSFRFYTSVAACTADTAFSAGTAKGTVALNGSNPGVADPSDATAALTPGTYAFKAKWPGMTGYTGSISSCETFTVTQARLGVNTTVHSDSPDQALVGNLELGEGAHDSAAVTGGVTGFALPDVTFYFFARGVACTNGSTAGGTQLNTLAPDSSGVAHPSTSETNLAAGTYNFMAVVAGDSNYLGATSDCEPFTVNKAQLGISTIVHDSAHTDITNNSVALGSIVHDTATVTGGVGGFPVPTSVSFALTSNYTTLCASGTAVGNDGTELSGAYKSADSLALSAGNYAYRASIAGDDNYIGANSTCEPFTVNKAQLTVTTNIHNADHQIVTSVATGSVVHDTATLSGTVNGFTPPAITFTFYANSTCTGDGSSVANVGADENDSSLVRSANSAALAAGSYSYKASVAGDSNYLGDSSDCEPLTVNAFWCSPGFWAQNQDKLAGSAYDPAPYLDDIVPGTSYTVGYALANPNIVGGTVFNQAADYLAVQFGWSGTHVSGDNCPIDAHGNFTGTLTIQTL